MSEFFVKLSVNPKESDNKWFGVNQIKIERGTTPQYIKQKCLDLCKDYLGGIWLQLTINEVEVRRLSGGLTNQTFYCGIRDKLCAKEPQTVAIRLYAEKHFNNLDNESNNRLTDTIIALMASEIGLGPQIYGLFEGGEIQKYYKHKNFSAEEQNDPNLVDDLARKLARIHAMEVPIKKTGNWIFDYFDDSYKVSNERFDLKTLIEESNSQTFKNYDLKKELEWLKMAIIKINSPQTFTHVDFRCTNIMVTQSNDIVVSDFEYSCNGPRGFDFGSIFVEWGRVRSQWDKPHEFPSDETIKPFIESYIEESAKLRGKQFIRDNRNSLEHILKEVKVFSLVGVMFYVLLFLKINESIIPDIPFNKLESMVSLDRQYKTYHDFKKLFIEQNIIVDIDSNNNSFE